MQLSEQQRHQLADIHAVYMDLMAAVAAQEVNLVQRQAGSCGVNGCSSSSSSHMRSSSSIADVQSHSALQRGMQLWAGVRLTQRKVSPDAGDA